MSEKIREKHQATILIVDDLEVNVSILENIVTAEGYQALCALNVNEALEMMNETMPQLILSDYYMPDIDGLEFCELLKKNPKTRDIPFMLITVADTKEDKRRAFEAGVVDYISKPFERTEVLMRVQTQLDNYYAKQAVEENNRMMHRVITEQKRQMEREQESLLVSLAGIVAKRNPMMGEHLRRVAENSRILAQCLQLSPQYENDIDDEFVDAISAAAGIHDLGILALKDSEMQEGHITVTEEYIRLHTDAGAELLDNFKQNSISSRFLDVAHDIAKYHHAHWDGAGYPKGVSGTDIPLAARIVGVLSDFDMQVECLGSSGAALEEATRKIVAGSGTAYEPFIVEMFRKVTKQFSLPA